MLAVQQTEEELKNHLREQYDFLIRSTNAYDEGYTSEAKRLAVVIRVLMHDTGASYSLLRQLNKKDIKFYETAIPYNPKNLLTHMGLLMGGVTVGKGGEYVPPLDAGPPIRYAKGRIPFDDWWKEVVVKDDKGNTLTRKDLVLAVSNQDGGAHIDPKLDEAYAGLSRGNSLGWVYVEDGKEQPFATGAELASVRQIAYEVIKTLKEEFADILGK